MSSDAPKRDFCRANHEFTEENTYYAKRKSGGLMRVCRTCQRRRQREYYLRNVDLERQRALARYYRRKKQKSGE